MAGEEVTEEAKKAGNAVWRQIKPWGDGKGLRNLALLSLFAGVSAVAIMSGGTAAVAAMPFDTMLSATFNTASSAVPFTPTGGTLPAIGSLAAEFFAHVGNGIYHTGAQMYNAAIGVDWSDVGDKAANAYDALQGPE